MASPRPVCPFCYRRLFRWEVARQRCARCQVAVLWRMERLLALGGRRVS